VGHRSRLLLLASLSTAVAGALLAGQAAAAGAASAQRASVSHSAVAHGAVAPGLVYVPTGQTLTMGMKGAAVKALQRRLNFLHYYAGTVDGDFGWHTMEAVWAFKEVQTGKAIPANPDIVGPAMQRLLVHPKLPPVLRRHATWTRIEVNKNIGVLVVYHQTRIVLISHVSTAAYCRPDGCGYVTPDGIYRAWLFEPGPVADSTYGGYMYNPVYFIGTAFAIHGMPDPTTTFSPDGVPLNAASHGCVRIPMDISTFLHTLIHVRSHNGTLIYIEGHDQADGGI